ncbi:MAG: hypothetical protein A3E85_03290 [Gammaproteobacteria bacterium RIFCSPHIGHO2_12_FULL_45_12]|nr:MAG: hypothetical protein A3E85_03290 [Gammaproteobacteria bacterium RIFCSPHIGHO2_12_FULL_45_12]
MKIIKQFVSLRLFFLCLCLPCLSAQAMTAHLNADYTILPFKLLYQLPIFTLQIQGHRIPAFIDLGSSNTWIALNQSLAKNLAVTDDKKQTYFLQNRCGQRYQTTLVRLPDATLGSVIFTQVPTLIFSATPACSFSSSVKKLDHYGIIGTNLLKSFRLILDYPHQRFVLVKNRLPKPYAKLRWIVLPLKQTPEGNISSRVLINGQPVNAVWDTGATTSVVSKEYASDAKQPENKLPLSIANHDFGKLDFYVLPQNHSPYAASIGNNFFANHIVLIDFNRNELRIGQA